MSGYTITVQRSFMEQTNNAALSWLPHAYYYLVQQRIMVHRNKCRDFKVRVSYSDANIPKKVELLIGLVEGGGESLEAYASYAYELERLFGFCVDL